CQAQCERFGVLSGPDEQYRPQVERQPAHDLCACDTAPFPAPRERPKDRAVQRVVGIVPRESALLQVRSKLFKVAVEFHRCLFQTTGTGRPETIERWMANVAAEVLRRSSNLIGAARPLFMASRKAASIRLWPLS